MTLTHARLTELLYYDPQTGLFTWKKTASPKAVAGEIAGCENAFDYAQIKIDYRQYRAHRLAWLYMTGEWPVGEIDHINGVRSDNRFVNLRKADRTENARNRRKPKSNNSGFKGVSFDKTRGTWRASIQVHGMTKYLGRFRSLEEAHLAYVQAAEAIHGAFANPG